MFCDEIIQKVYTGVIEDDDVYSHNAFFDCFHEIAYHCTTGYRLVLETENYAISLSCNGVCIEKKEELQERPGEWLQNGIELFEGDEPPFVSLETTLFVGERLNNVRKENNIYLLQFDDFFMKLIPHEKYDGIEGLRNRDYWSYNYVLGCNRHLKQNCPCCGAAGEILLDFVSDFVVRCKNCKKSTFAEMQVRYAIENWNKGEVQCDLSDITIE